VEEGKLKNEGEKERQWKPQRKREVCRAGECRSLGMWVGSKKEIESVCVIWQARGEDMGSERSMRAKVTKSQERKGIFITWLADYFSFSSYILKAYAFFTPNTTHVFI
jgi:hypothetical protein